MIGYTAVFFGEHLMLFVHILSSRLRLLLYTWQTWPWSSDLEMVNEENPKIFLGKLSINKSISIILVSNGNKHDHEIYLYIYINNDVHCVSRLFTNESLVCWRRRSRLDSWTETLLLNLRRQLSTAQAENWTIMC